MQIQWYKFYHEEETELLSWCITDRRRTERGIPKKHYAKLLEENRDSRNVFPLNQ